MSGDIFEQLNDIPGVADFMAKPAPGLTEVPVTQRVQEVLADHYGAAWAGVRVFSWMLPTGQMVHAAFGPVSLEEPTKIIMHIVGERADGGLVLSEPVKHDEDEDEPTWDGPDAEAERRCLSKILPALIEVRDIVNAAPSVQPRRKVRICHQLMHASEHLSANWEAMREGA